MKVEKVGNKYRVRKRHNGINYTVSFDYKPSKKEAEEAMFKKISSEDISGDLRDSFKESAEKYIRIKSNVLSPSTINGYLSILRALSPRFLNQKTAQITQESIQKEINDYSREHSPKSVRNLHGFVSAVLSVYRPSFKIYTTLPQKVKYEAVTPSEKDIKALLSAVKGSKYEIAYRLGVYGLRRGEICALSSADLDGNIIKINKSKVLGSEGYQIKPFPKTTGSQREIYIDNSLADLLRKQGVAFTENPDAINHHLHRLEKRLGLPSFRFHDLRAYYATMSHSLGIPDAYIMASGGWTSTNILNRVYKRTFAEKQEEANRIYSEHLPK